MHKQLRTQLRSVRDCATGEVPWLLFALALPLLLVGCLTVPTPTGSIGAVLGRDGETRDIYVKEVADPPPGGERSHLIPGDQIMMVEGVMVRELKIADLRKRLRGAPGTEVNLTVLRGGEVLRLKVKRSAMKAPVLAVKEERVAEE